jgi:hypothetical protein
MAQNSIILKNYSDVFEEYTAGGTIYPGMLLSFSAANTVVAHADDAPTAGCLTMFACEDALQGKDIDQTYVTGDKVKVWVPGRGDEVYAILEDGANVAFGAYLESNGAGYLQAFSSGNGAVAIALETLDLTGSSGIADSSAPLGFNKRIKVKIL